MSTRQRLNVMLAFLWGGHGDGRIGGQLATLFPKKSEDNHPTIVRLPAALRNELIADAKENFRSLSEEVIARLEQSFGARRLPFASPRRGCRDLPAMHPEDNKSFSPTGVRLSPMLRNQLVRHARAAGISLNQEVIERLAASYGNRFLPEHLMNSHGTSLGDVPGACH